MYIVLFQGKTACPYQYGERSHLCFKLDQAAAWSRTCDDCGYEPVAITTSEIQDDLNKLPFRGPYWVSGTNMRWIWRTG